MPNEIPGREKYSMTAFLRRTGCSEWAARGFQCEMFSKTASAHAIMTARKKPAHCSEARWRMELRRRALQKALGRYYVGATAKHH